MKFFADFHVHSKYSRATSPLMDIEYMDKWAKIKGVSLLGTGDFTHPLWLDNLERKLEPAEPGLFKIKGMQDSTRFALTCEISCIWSQNKKVRKVHIVVFAPSFEAVLKINAQLSKVGNLKADGRPILGLDAQELLKIVLSSDENCLITPAHAWTPWFGIFGSKSGFDSLDECFGDYSKYIYSAETGLSSDPKMFWRISFLDKISIISNSDAHSPQKIGREANFFDSEMNYFEIVNALKEKDKNKFLYTVEFFPEEGKYHYDGHRDCGASFSPAESKKLNNICPKCRKNLTIGVLNRAEELADRPDGFAPGLKIPFKSLIPLKEIAAECLGVSAGAKKAEFQYEKLIKNLGNEFKILLEASRQDIEKAGNNAIAEGVIRVREGKVFIEPGYDGIYGKIKIFQENEKKDIFLQKALF